MTRNLELTSGLIFLISALPVFWQIQLFGNPVRVFIWLLPLVLGRLVRTLFGGMKRSDTKSLGSSP
jgi:hypothetical protein